MTETDVARGRVLAAQLDGILEDYEGAQHEATYDRRGMPVDVCQRLVTRSVAAIHRIAGATSVYARDAARIEGDCQSSSPCFPRYHQSSGLSVPLEMIWRLGAWRLSPS